MVARQRQGANARVPDRDRERAAQDRPNIVAEFLPGGEKHARIRPGRRRLRRDADPSEHFVAIVEPDIRRDQRAAFALPGLAIELVFRGHAHQHVDKADGFAGDDRGAIRPVLTQRIGDALEVVSGHGPAVEPQEAGDTAHRKPTCRISTLRRMRRGE